MPFIILTTASGAQPGVRFSAQSKFPFSKNSRPCLGSPQPLIQGVEWTSLLYSEVVRTLDRRLKFHLVPTLRVTGDTPLLRQHALMAGTGTSVFMFYRGCYTAHRGAGLPLGSASCTEEVWKFWKWAIHHADGSGIAGAVTNCSCACCRYFIRQLPCSLSTATPQ
jgi:hypothetical protein